MAERRMFAKTIVLSDAFLDMPLSARALYMTLGVVADDDGFVNNPKSIMRQCGASQDDMNILLLKKFLIAFDSGVVVIKHWRINNYLRSDRYQETKYLDEKNQLRIEENGSYTINSVGIPGGIPNRGYPDKNRIDKDRVDKSSVEFDLFWRAYPRKDGKKTAKEKFDRLEDIDVQVLIRAIEKQKQSSQWQRDNGRYIPLPATWLNQRRWEDEGVEGDSRYDNYFNDAIRELASEQE